MTTTLTAAQWNRTVLSRQHLLERADEDAVDVIDRCVGLGARDPQAPFFALFSRIADFDPAELDDLLSGREVVRMGLHRGETTLIDGLDARWIHALRCSAGPGDEDLGGGDLGSRDLGGRDLGGADCDELLELVSSLFTRVGDGDDATPAGAAVPGAVIRETLARRWPGVPVASLIAVVRTRLPLVQVPPRGLWRCEGPPAYHLLDHWIGDGVPMVDGDEARRDLIRMYLRGHGPASAPALVEWSGLPELAPLLAAMAADWELAEFTGPDGRLLYDLEGLPTSTGEEPAPVRLLAPNDGALAAAADRGALADPGVYAAAIAGVGAAGVGTAESGRTPGFVLVDGRLAGTWVLESPGQKSPGQESPAVAAPAVRLRQLVDLQPAQRAEVEREAARLTAFAGR